MLMLSLQFPGSAAYAGVPSDPLGVTVTKPLRDVTVTDNGNTGTINVALPYGTEYQMFHAVIADGSTLAMYESDGTTEIPPISTIQNNGDYKFGPGAKLTWTGSTYHLVVKNGDNSRDYTVTVTVATSTIYPTTDGDIISPMNIRAGEFGGDNIGSSAIGYGSWSNSMEAPGKDSSYSGLDWQDSFYTQDGGGYNVQPSNPAWMGDNMYLQPIARDDLDGKLTNYGIANIPGTDKLQSDILRIHEFEPIPARDDGDRGAVGSDRQRLELKGNSPGNVNANGFGGDIMTYHWNLMLPSETLRYQKDTGSYKKGDLIVPHAFFHIFQIKDLNGPNSQPNCTVTLASHPVDKDGTIITNPDPNITYEYKGFMEFRDYPINGTNGQITVAYVPFDKIVDRWVEATVTMGVSDSSHIYVQFKNMETGKVLAEASFTGNTYRRPENGDTSVTDEPITAGQMNRPKWGLYRGMYNTSSLLQYADEFQSATQYFSDIYVVKHDANTYVYPDGFNPKTASKDIVAWNRFPDITVPPGTPLESLNLDKEPYAQDNIVLSTGKTVISAVYWDTSTYKQNISGTQKIYGTFKDSTFDSNSKNIRPYVEVVMSNYRNWAEDSATVLKVNSNSGKNGLLTGGQWSTHSTMVPLGVKVDSKGNPTATPNNYFWAAVSLPQAIDLNEIVVGPFTTGSTGVKSRIRDLQFYYSNTADSFEQLEEGGSTPTNATKDPLTLGGWTEISGAKIDGQLNNQNLDIITMPHVTGKYFLMRAMIVNSGSNGAVTAKNLQFIGEIPGTRVKLDDIKIDGVSLSSTTSFIANSTFDQDRFDYTVILPSTKAIKPVVTGIANTADASVNVTYPDDYKMGVVVVTVTKPGLAPSIYNIKFNVIGDDILGTINMPKAYISRADFMQLIVKTLGLTAKVDSNFDDVKTSDYYYNTVGIAKKLGICGGVGENKFDPNAQITRQDMMVLIERAMKSANKIKTTGNSSDLEKFNDKAAIASYAIDAISTLVSEGIVQGDGSTLNPLDYATRAETAVVMYRVYNK